MEKTEKIQEKIPPCLSWGLMDRKAVKNAALYLPHPGPLETAADIDSAVENLTRQLQEKVENTVPIRAKIFPKKGPAYKFWDFEVQ